MQIYPSWHPAKGLAIQDAEGVLDALCDALAWSGVPLPSLGLDASTWSGDSEHALLELGRCNLVTARKLITALHTVCGERES